MESIIEQLIVDFQKRDLPALTTRRTELPWLKNKADTIIGMRRSGKTYFLFQIAQNMIASGIPREAILYLNMEDERLIPLSTVDLQLIPDIFYRLQPSMRDRECVFLFDEIQNIECWERFIRRLLDTEKIHICLTGSSAKLLSKEIATSLRGRSLATEIFPFSFLEALEHQKINIELKKRPDSKTRAMLENRFKAYLLAGGFPEVQNIEAEHRIRVLQEYLDVVILRDIVERNKLANITPLRYMIRHILNNPGSLFSVNKFYNDLRSQGISGAKNTLHDYLAYLTDSYLFFQVFMSVKSERARMVNPRKVYAVDTGLVMACSHGLRPEWGHLLENLVFLELRRRHKNIEYYKTTSGKEIDFLIETQNGRALIQVAADLRDKHTRERELRALQEAMKECGVKRAMIITLTDEEQIKDNSLRIDVIPAWLWILRGSEIF
jgi:uncharacterized protein